MKILIIAMANSDNLGDVVIYECIKRLLENAGHTVTAFDFNGSDRQTDSPHLIELGRRKLLASRFKRILGKSDSIATIINKIRWRKKKKAFRKTCINRFSDADCVLIGGGQLITDIFFGLPSRFKEILDALILTRRPYHIIYCGVGRSFSREARTIYRNLVLHASTISVRGDNSRSTLENLAPEKSVLSTPDPVFLCSSLFPITVQKQRDTLGLCYQEVRFLTMHHPFFRSIGLDGVNKFIKDVIDQFLQAGKKVSIFTNGDHEDYLAASSFFSDNYSTNKSVSLAPLPTNERDLLDRISSYSFVISFRMHAAIIAYSYGVPTLNIVWDPKVIEVWERLGDPSAYIDLSTIEDWGAFNWPQRLQQQQVDVNLLKKADAQIKNALSFLLERENI